MGCTIRVWFVIVRPCGTDVATWTKTSALQSAEGPTRGLGLTAANDAPIRGTINWDQGRRRLTARYTTTTSTPSPS